VSFVKSVYILSFYEITLTIHHHSQAAVPENYICLDFLCFLSCIAREVSKRGFLGKGFLLSMEISFSFRTVTVSYIPFIIIIHFRPKKKRFFLFKHVISNCTLVP
jgi:hypothetical protein